MSKKPQPNRRIISGLIIVVAILLALGRLNESRTAHNLPDCINTGGCENIVVMNGSTTLTGKQLDELMRSQAMRDATKRIKRCFRTQISDATVYAFTVDSQNGEEAVLLPILRSPKAEVFDLGTLLQVILKTEAYPMLPQSRTFKDLYDQLALLVQPIVPELNAAGISSVKLGTRLYPTDQLSRVFADIARDNAKKPLSVIRP